MAQETEIAAACRQIARHFNGQSGEFAYQAFDYLNAEYFSGELPTPLIIWTLTAFGRCLGQTQPSGVREPIIALHPSLLGGTIKINPWGVDPALLGTCFALDVLLHESIHVSVHYRLGGGGDYDESSHNSTNWCAEVNRIAQALGFGDFNAQPTRPCRVPVETTARTVRGKTPTKVARVTTGNIDLQELSAFPGSTRSRLGLTDFYQRNVLPFCSTTGKGRGG